MFYTYVLKGTSNPQYYIGFTADLRKRFAQHNAGANISTRRGRPWRLIYYEAFEQEKFAQQRERLLKQRGKAWKMVRIGERSIAPKKVLGDGVPIEE